MHEFEALLSEALDGTLLRAQLEHFEWHRSTCPTCGPMFAEARRGMQLLRGLAEVEPPANFVHNVLAATIGRVEEAAPAAHAREGWWNKFLAGLRQGRPVLQPKFAMSFAMAFFSISLVLNLAGVISVTSAPPPESHRHRARRLPSTGPRGKYSNISSSVRDRIARAGIEARDHAGGEQSAGGEKERAQGPKRKT